MLRQQPPTPTPPPGVAGVVCAEHTRNAHTPIGVGYLRLSLDPAPDVGAWKFSVTFWAAIPVLPAVPSCVSMWLRWRVLLVACAHESRSHLIVMLLVLTTNFILGCSLASSGTTSTSVIIATLVPFLQSTYLLPSNGERNPPFCVHHLLDLTALSSTLGPTSPNTSNPSEIPHSYHTLFFFF